MPLWKKHETEAGECFYENTDTGETQWEVPEGFVEMCDPNWVEQTDSTSGNIYYYNTATEVSQWEKPDGFVSPLVEVSVWAEHIDSESNKIYYYNEVTGESVWEKPEGFVAQEIQAVQEEEDGTQPISIPSGTDADQADDSRLPAAASSQAETRRPSVTVKNVQFSGATQFRRDGSIVGPPLDRNIALDAEGTRGEGAHRRHSSVIVGLDHYLDKQAQAASAREPSKRKSISVIGASGSTFRIDKGIEHDSTATPSTSTPSTSSTSDLPDPAPLNGEPSSSSAKGIDVSSLDPALPLEDYAQLLGSVSLNTYAWFHVPTYRRTSIFSSNNRILAGQGSPKPVALAQDAVNSSVLKWSHDVLEAPLTSLTVDCTGSDSNVPLSNTTPEDLSKAARELSKHIMSFMGDRTTNRSSAAVATSIITLLMQSSPSLRDEAFMQICKQIIQNPSFQSVEKGWHLLLVCLASFPPSSSLAPCLMAFCVSAALAQQQLVRDTADVSFDLRSNVSSLHASNSSRIGAIATTPTSPEPRTPPQPYPQSSSNANYGIYRCAEVAARACILSAHLPPRQEMISIDEFETLRRGGDTDINVYLLDGASVTIRCNSWTSVAKLASQVGKELSINRSNESCFALFEGDFYASEGQLDANERVLDLAMLWGNNQKSVLADNSNTPGVSNVNNVIGTNAISPYRFLYKVCSHRDCLAKYSTMIDSDPAAAKVFYIQAVSDVLNARYPLLEREAVILAALHAQEQLGDIRHPDNAASKPSARMAAILQGRSLYYFIHRRYLGNHNDTSAHIFARRQDVESALVTAYEKLRGYTAHEARLAYLLIIRANRVYGATYYAVQTANGLVMQAGFGSTPAELVLAVTPRSIIAMQPDNAQYLAEYPYNHISEWGHKAHTSTVVIITSGLGSGLGGQGGKAGGEGGEERIYFKCADEHKALEMVERIAAYSHLSEH